MATKDRQLVDELHIEDGEFERVRNLRPPWRERGGASYCGGPMRSGGRGEVRQPYPDHCVVCVEMAKADPGCAWSARFGPGR